MMQAQDEINKKLMDFSENDMQFLNDMFQKKGADGLNEVYKAGLFSSLEMGMSKDEADNRNQTITKFNKIMQSLKDNTSNNQNDQLRAILANNVFKATVKIMGDPTFGHNVLPWEISMKTNFKDVGQFGSTVS